MEAEGEALPGSVARRAADRRADFPVVAIKKMIAS
jgi:hypothetical protein